MDYINIGLGLLEAGLKLWQHKDKNKYLDKTIKLKRKFYEEYNKETPDMAILDNIEFELWIISQGFIAKIGEKNS